MSAQWYITAPGGSETVLLAAQEVASLQLEFKIMAASTATLQIHRDFDSDAPWYAADEIVRIYRANSPTADLAVYFTGRVQETPIAADPEGEYRTLSLADAWLDLEEIVYQEEWAVGSGSVMLPKAFLGIDKNGDTISTTQQISAAVTYAISQTAAMTLGTVASGVTVWPSESVNTSCADIILGELRWNPSMVAYLYHGEAVPVFRVTAAGDLPTTIIDVTNAEVQSFSYAPLVRTLARGVRILYEDASTIDGVVYRSGYIDEAGETEGRKVMHATIELAGVDMQYQKSRIETRNMPTNAATMTAYFKKKWPELKDMPDAAFVWKNVSFALAPLAEQPPPVNDKAPRLEVTDYAEIPRELVRGQIEDWMRKKVGQVTVTYDLHIKGNPPIDKKKILDNFSGRGKTFTVTCTDAVTKTYKGVSSFTEGEGVPEGIAEAVYEAASVQTYEGNITLAMDDVSSVRWIGRKIALANDGTEMMPATVIHSASVDVANGVVSLSFGPLPYLSAGDFLELQRMAKGRPVTWMSAEERASNELGASTKPGSKGDTVAGFDLPGIIVPPGSGSPELPFNVKLGKALDDTYYVTVEHGVVIERNLSALLDEQATRYFPATNRTGEDGLQTEFAIEVGQAIFVVVTDDNFGKIDAAVPVVLAVDDKEKKSLNYIPGVQTGVTYYKLAELEIAEGNPRLKYFCARSNIKHDGGLTADVVLETCPHIPPGETSPVPGEQLIRMSFVSGKLAVVGKTVAERAYAETLEISAIDAETCT